MATPDRVLDIITEDQARPTVWINQVEYLLRTKKDLALDVYKTLERITPPISALLAADTLTPEQGSELGQLLDRVCRIALVAPDAGIHDRLCDLDRLGVYQVFMELLTPSLLRVARAVAQKEPRATGPTPSRASSASTAAPLKGGSQRRRSASSGRA